jgi:hypothetical protein
VTASVKGNKDLLELVGLRDNHSYSLLSIHEIEHKGSKIRLMKMRNPWGNFEWDGSWGDDSQEWKEVSMNLKKELKYKQTNDGIFFIQFEDFIKYFSVFSKTIRFDALKDKHNTVMCDLKNGSELFYSFEI